PQGSEANAAFPRANSKALSRNAGIHKGSEVSQPRRNARADDKAIPRGPADQTRRMGCIRADVLVHFRCLDVLLHPQAAAERPLSQRTPRERSAQSLSIDRPDRGAAGNDG